MRKVIGALALALALCLSLAAVAAADPGPIQVSGQDATTQQQSEAASGATQVDPSNTNVSIRVLSPGNDGNVTQSNTASSSATSGNQAGTTQTAGQTAGGSGIQSSQQNAGTDQVSAALSAAEQAGASNANLPIRVLSEGDDGNVTQSNGVDSKATSGNAATTGQTSTQTQGGSCGCGSGSGIQTGKQDAGTEQESAAASEAKQIDPSNTNVSIRVLSPGNGGNVTQSNTATSNAMSGNTAGTTQSATQAQGGKGCGCTTITSEPASKQDAATDDPATALAAPVTGVNQSNSDGSAATSGNQGATGQTSQQSASGAGIQTGYQSAGTEQSSAALSGAKQIDASNTSDPVRVLSHGNDGNVTQSNSVSSNATSGNKATTTQTSSQAQGGSCGCSQPIQVAGQQAWTGQESLAGSFAGQFGASNDASPTRVLSKGDGGNVTQSNSVYSKAASGNTATTGQTSNQLAGSGRECGCATSPIQVVAQKSGTEQGSLALSAAVQAFGHGHSDCGCGGSTSGNDASPVRVWSPGYDGNVTQSNSVTSSATSGNSATTGQGAWQGAGGNAIQVAGQEAETGQASLAGSLAAQFGASNTASPVRVYSKGGGGSVSQQNTDGSTAASGNTATTGQNAGQYAGSPCGCGRPIQVAGQKADTGQLSKALSAAFQIAAANGSDPTRVKSWGGDGWTTQGNASTSRGDSGNGASTAGTVMQKS